MITKKFLILIISAILCCSCSEEDLNSKGTDSSGPDKENPAPEDSDQGGENSDGTEQGDSDQGDSNSGGDNQGDSGQGDSNSGGDNQGDSGQGDSNSDDDDQGDSGEGDSNSDDDDQGDSDQGDSNSDDDDQGDSDQGDQNTEDGSTSNEEFSIESSSFVNGGVLPNRFSYAIPNQCSGINNFPHLSWSSPPNGTQSFVIIVQDPDGNDWVHLNLYDIPGDQSEILELTASISTQNALLTVTFPFGSIGANSWFTTGWGGPCPPSGTHTYIFRIYALNIANLGTPLHNKTFAAFETDYGDNILGQAEIEGTVSAL